ncbi:hypothetical protein JCM5353_001456 [Sporobolomyces roseus]
MPDRIRTLDGRSSIVYPHGKGWKGAVSKFASQHLNFYRIHLLFFTFLPLIASAIFYASNGPSPQNQIAYIDCLFLCFSAMTVCGLTTALFANITIWQQVILFLLMTMGSISFVSIMVILVRRHFFQKRFEYLVENNAAVRDRLNDVGAEEARAHGREYENIPGPTSRHVSATLVGDRTADEALQMESIKRKQNKKLEKLRADMIRRVDTPVRVNEMNVSGRIGTPVEDTEPVQSGNAERPQHISYAETAIDRRLPRHLTLDVPNRQRSNDDLRLRRNRTTTGAGDHSTRRPSRSGLRDMNSRSLQRTTTMPSAPAIESNFGGFPNPLKVVADFATSRIAPLRRVQDNAFPRTSTLVSTRSRTRRPSMESVGAPKYSKPVDYISFDATVGRNSRFHHLTTAQQEELGGVEYRALSLLLKIVVGYWLGIQLIAVLTIAPWLTYSQKYADVFTATDPPISPTFFAFHQVFSGLSNTGMSLVDASMVPFQDAYWLIILVAFLILAGNTALPIFLRLTIWTFSKLVPSDSRIRETLQFLLDHPRRCYVYLFPSKQTWFLVFVLICLNGIDWVAFIVLDIGNPQIMALSPGVRCIDGLFQAIAVRTAGFSIVGLATVAPALQFLFVGMMYVSAYPIAISVRASNVYEEKAVGVQETEEDDEEFETEARPSSYILHHVRRQLAFDIWYLCTGIFILCIIERHRIESGDWSEVTVFSLLFEAVSAYGTVGLSLGNNRNATSLAGVLSPGSKLILIAIMLRGRHRGLPVAIDRSILLPFDLSREQSFSLHSNPNQQAVDDLLPRRNSISTITQAHMSAYTSEPQSDPNMVASTSAYHQNESKESQQGSTSEDFDEKRDSATTSSSSLSEDDRKTIPSDRRA